MANPLAEGIFPCTVLLAKSGADEKGIPQVQITVRFDGGPNDGRQTIYEDRVDAKSALYVSRSCMAVGWAGRTMNTIEADAKAWIAKTGGKTTAEIKHISFTDKKTGEPRIWDKCNSIGRGAKPLQPLAGERLADADEALRNAMRADRGDVGTPPPDDAPHAATAEEDLPFISCSIREPSPIAKVLK